MRFDWSDVDELVVQAPMVNRRIGESDELDSERKSIRGTVRRQTEFLLGLTRVPLETGGLSDRWSRTPRGGDVSFSRLGETDYLGEGFGWTDWFDRFDRSGRKARNLGNVQDGSGSASRLDVESKSDVAESNRHDRHGGSVESVLREMPTKSRGMVDVENWSVRESRTPHPHPFVSCGARAGWVVVEFRWLIPQ